MIAMMPHPPLPRALSFLHSRLASTPPRPAHHHIDLPAAATGADQPFAPIEDGRFGAVPSSHFGGIGFDPMLAFPAPHDQPDAGGGRVAERHR
jgi:hypothetical protein